MKVHYVMKLAVMIKNTQCVLDTELVHLWETIGDSDSHMCLLNTVEELRNGVTTDDGKYEIKAIPVSAHKSQDKLIAFDANSKKGEWYIKHSKTAEIAFFSLIEKIVSLNENIA